jgi:hypothetical protein
LGGDFRHRAVSLNVALGNRKDGWSAAIRIWPGR